MSQYSSLTKTEALFVKENGRLLKIYYESIMNYHGGAMPAGVALAFRLFSGLTERYQAIFDGFPERDSVYFYTGVFILRSLVTLISKKFPNTLMQFVPNIPPKIF